MKKISLYIMALLTMGFAACNEDFETTTSPLSNPQESILQTTDVQFTPASISSINLADLIANDNPIVLGTVNVKDGAMPSGMGLKAVVHLDVANDFSNAVSVDAESMEGPGEIRILPSKLQDAYVNNFTRDPNTTTLYIRTNLYTTIGDESQACIGDPANSFFGNYTVNFTPVDEVGVKISKEYYPVVQKLDGSYEVGKKCTHSKKNVYDDPEFTTVIEALKDENGIRQDTKYGFIAVEDIDAFNGGNSSVMIGDGGNNMLAKGGNPFVGPADDGAVKYNITLDMEAMTIVIKPEIQFFCYYLYPNSAAAFNMKIEDPETYENYMFYQTDNTTYTYTTFWPNNNNGRSDLNIKLWEREAMKTGTTTKTWGFDGGSRDERKESGNLKQPGQWFGPLTEGFYTLTITMDEKKNNYTYKWTAWTEPITEYTNISIIGSINGDSWSTDVDLTQCAKASHNWCLLNFTLTADADLKFRANHNWDTKDWGGDGSQSLNKSVYTLKTGGENIKVPAGTYNFYLNDITGDWSILNVTE